MRPGLQIETLLTSRSFFGVYRVHDSRSTILKTRLYSLPRHDHSRHAELRGAGARRTALLLLPHGPDRKSLRLFQRRSARRRTSACCAGAGRGSARGVRRTRPEHFTFYEIDPVVRWLASDSGYFSYLPDARARGAKISVEMGDARLSLRNAPPDHGYGLLVLDVFSSDSIPMHLMTREAVQLYLSKLAPHGSPGVSRLKAAIWNWIRSSGTWPPMRVWRPSSGRTCRAPRTTKPHASGSRTKRTRARPNPHWVLLARDNTRRRFRRHSAGSRLRTGSRAQGAFERRAGVDRRVFRICTASFSGIGSGRIVSPHGRRDRID